MGTECNSALSTEHIRAVWDWEILSQAQNDNKGIQKQLFVTLENDEQKIYDYLQKNGKQLLDVMAIDCDFPVFKISSTLLNMELKGVIRPLPGKLFEVV